MKKPAVLYLNGPNGVRRHPRQKQLITNLARQGFPVCYAALNWQNGSFEEHLDKTVSMGECLLRSRGSLAIIGWREGSSLTVNTFGRLAKDYEAIQAIAVAGQLNEKTLHASMQYQTQRMTNLARRSTASHATYDSVNYCETVTLPGLTPEQKQRIFVAKQMFDLVLPQTILAEQIVTLQPITDDKLLDTSNLILPGSLNVMPPKPAA